ncbi:VWA domain-containing protein [Pseudogemmobacter faecipullorum]|uniref:VWA domain-containing protein n=1 Tax=Pseudogemmobacter faecipullorum TaxID=2755041 RepID=A0ABS8CIG9_9RHOB|nr:VWA domain-containing protein [Pseudogemmobacter faecipullorum]MCB5409202.1 VWA domain-containing protein [Pseudogemmobacter faecipullorum]
MISFAFLPALLLLPLPLVMLLLPPRAAAEGAMRLPEAIALSARPAAAPGQSLGLIAFWLGWALLCLALAGPQSIALYPDRSASGRDILIALDMSGSMETEDFALDGQTVTRLAAVKRVAESFIRARRGDRMGLILFADHAYVAAPLTHDLEAVARGLGEAQIGIAGRSTNLSGGLGLAIKRMQASTATSKAIILLSDGRDTAGRVDLGEVARLGAGLGLKIYTVALGPEDLESRPAARDAVDLAALRSIAEGSGGEVFRVRSLEDLQAMAAEMDRLEPNPSSRPPVAEAQTLWPWPAALALLCLIAGGLAPLAARAEGGR